MKLQLSWWRQAYYRNTTTLHNWNCRKASKAEWIAKVEDPFVPWREIPHESPKAFQKLKSEGLEPRHPDYFAKKKHPPPKTTWSAISATSVIRSFTPAPDVMSMWYCVRVAPPRSVTGEAVLLTCFVLHSVVVAAVALGVLVVFVLLYNEQFIQNPPEPCCSLGVIVHQFQSAVQYALTLEGETTFRILEANSSNYNEPTEMPWHPWISTQIPTFPWMLFEKTSLFDKAFLFHMVNNDRLWWCCQDKPQRRLSTVLAWRRWPNWSPTSWNARIPTKKHRFKNTILGSNTSPPKVCLKMTILFRRWDMSVS